MLEIVGVKKKLENFELFIDYLKIERGEYFVFLGLSGAGKTTLLEIISGFRKPDSGKIMLNRVDITDKNVNERKIAVCQGYLFPHMSVYSNIAYGIKGNKKEKVKELAKMLEIEHLLDRMPETLSMGEKQRVAIARALAVNPEVILLDEPLNSLDRLTHESLMVELKKLHEETDTTFIHVTHDFVEAITLASRIAIIRKGKIEQCDTVENILKHPKNEFVAKFVGMKNLLDGYVCSNKVDCGIELQINKNVIKTNGKSTKKVKVGIRPEDIMIISSKNCRFVNYNVFDAKVVDIYPLTLSTSRVVLDVEGVELIAETVKSKVLRMGLKRGSKVKICITDVSIINHS